MTGQNEQELVRIMTAILKEQKRSNLLLLALTGDETATAQIKAQAAAKKVAAKPKPSLAFRR